MLFLSTTEYGPWVLGHYFHGTFFTISDPAMLIKKIQFFCLYVFVKLTSPSPKKNHLGRAPRYRTTMQQSPN